MDSYRRDMRALGVLKYEMIVGNVAPDRDPILGVADLITASLTRSRQTYCAAIIGEPVGELANPSAVQSEGPQSHCKRDQLQDAPSGG